MSINDASEGINNICKPLRICFFGHFGADNFGNDITFQAVLYHLGKRLPEAEVICICPRPEVLAATRKIKAVPIHRTFGNPKRLHTPFARLLRRIFFGVPSDLFRWFDAFKTLKAADMLIIPGTGLLTDAYGLMGWGPYNQFKWSLVAKVCRCKLLFLSVGAGPLYSILGKFFVKTALSIADYRSYRDSASMNYIKSFGFQPNCDRVYPDLAFSLPETMLVCNSDKSIERTTIGLGLMEDAGKYSVENNSQTIYHAYIENMVTFSRWLLAHNYNIRLLIGDICDSDVPKEFKSQLKASMGVYDEERVINEPILTVEDLLYQLAETDLVVATRFHNILLSLLLCKPVIALSFHPKCASLMSEMGLAEYSHDTKHMSAEKLIEKFQDMEKHTEKLRPMIKQKVEQFRKALDEQYSLIFRNT